MEAVAVLDQARVVWTGLPARMRSGGGEDVSGCGAVGVRTMIV